MNKRTIKILIYLTMLIIVSCSYKPIFIEKNYDFEIDKVTLSGEKNVNRVIKNNLKLIGKSNDNIKKKYNLVLSSTKKRKVLSKDSQGDPSKFEIILSINYQVLENDNLLLKRSIDKSYIYKNNSDKFKLEQNEKIIVENLTEDISNIIISTIINLNDN